MQFKDYFKRTGIYTMRDKMSVNAKFYTHGMPTIFLYLFISATKALT